MSEAGAATPSGTLEPILQPDAAAQLERLGVSELIRQGSVQLIGLAPIQARLGDRWARRAPQVWTHFATVLRKQLPPHDFVLQIDDLHFLIAQTQERGAAAQAICLRLAGELMAFFLGTASDEDIHVKMVTAAGNGHLTCEPLDVRAARGAQALPPPLAPARAESPLKRTSFPLLTRQGRRLKVIVSLEPMWVLQDRPRAVGHYARTTLQDETTEREVGATARNRLLPGELLDIDVAVLTEALSLRAASPRSSGGLLVPISYTAISNSNARYRLLHAIESFSATDRGSFAWELMDLEEGLPASRLAEMVALIRPWCRGVVCRVGASRHAAEQLRSAGTTASVASGGLPFGSRSLRQLEPFLTALRRTVPAVLLHDVPPHLSNAAGASGASHATFGQAVIGYVDD
ncbi:MULTISPECIES: hypothetical protein [unclassified Phenylobacterium]|uniref:hypothetical protein n=1 Tax=unclassified Phenylobacterium TaxID=2640670 RepID=UPI0018D21DC4|nr:MULTISPECIES: hypothetical protein [unclassified Phenylobacterium]